jgi:hypothetical protein
MLPNDYFYSAGQASSLPNSITWRRRENSHHTKCVHYFKKFKNMPFCSMHLSDSIYETYALKLNFLQEVVVLPHQLQVLTYTNKIIGDSIMTPSVTWLCQLSVILYINWLDSYLTVSPPGTFIGIKHNQNLREMQRCLVGCMPTRI